MFAAGIILYVMLTGHLPFRSGQLGELHREMMKGPSFDGPYSSTVSPEARHLIKQLLNINPVGRPDPAQAMAHTWLVTHRVQSHPTPMPKRRAWPPTHEPPLLNVHVDVGNDGQLVWDQLQLDGYFDTEEARKALECIQANTPDSQVPAVLQVSLPPPLPPTFRTSLSPSEGRKQKQQP